jgi:Flp pilus assembly pilin Flp
MKKTLLFMLLPFLCMSQTQIGNDIDGEAAGDISGQSVSLSSDGATLAIGAIQNDGSGNDAGSVRVYQNVSGTWTKVGADIDGDAAADYSGMSISLSSNGSVLAIGAYRNDANGIDSGSVRVYQNVTGTWTKVGANINGEAAGDLSGCSLSLSSDGSILAIGSSRNDGSGSNAGSVRVYKIVSGIWIKIGADIDGEVASENSGTSVSLSSDGSVIAIGAIVNSGNGAGTVRVYKYVSGIWTKIGANIDGEADLDFSGVSVSLSRDGSILAIGADSNDGNGTDAGSVRVYQNVSGTWTKIGGDIDGEAVEDVSGISVSLSSDGSVIAIGAPLNDGNGTDAGSVRVYHNVSGTWTKLAADIDGEAAGDLSGFSVSLSNDGSILAVGARLNDGNGLNSGSVRVYSLSAFLNSDSFVIANFSVYPNPAFEMVKVNLQEDLILEKVNIYNSLGQLVKTEKNNSISVNSLSKGSYFFEVITNKGKATKTILLQ